MTMIQDLFVGAVYRKDYNELRKLNSRGIDLNDTDADGRTALMHAVLAEDADPEMVEFLIEAGTDINIKDAGQQWSALHFAARDQKAEIVRVLLDKGAEVDAVDVFGNTPLWRCVMNASPNVEIIKALMGKGADPERKNNHGVSARDTAVNMGKAELVEILVKSKN